MAKKILIANADLVETWKILIVEEMEVQRISNKIRGLVSTAGDWTCENQMP